MIDYLLRTRGLLLAAAALALGAADTVQAAPRKPAARKPAARKTAAAKPAPKPAGPRLLKVSVAPTELTLDGPRSEQGLVVTGHYADGSVADVTRAAKFQVGNPRAVAVRLHESRRLVRPVADGSSRITVTVPGAAPVTVSAKVQETGKLAPVSFKDEVVPALTKLGCSMGTCHGTPTGKGGFRLSLQGYAPELDYHTLAREGVRRINKADPGRSLLLLKPLAEVPHAGGKRLYKEYPEFDVLVRWIAEGAHEDPEQAPELVKLEILPEPRQLLLPKAAKQQVEVRAHFSDGSVRDVTRLTKLDTSNPDAATITREGLLEGVERGDIAVLARYQHILTSSRVTFLKNVPGFKWNDPQPFNFVDQHVFNRLKLFQIPTSDLASDQEFVRRVYLDSIGLLPTSDEVRAFMADKSPDKRAKLIDHLTERPEFADYWAVKWADVLRIQDETLQSTGAKLFHQWVRDSIAANKPMDQFVREIVTATGPSFSVGPANFFRMSEKPEDIAEATSQLFLGVRMSCAKCHNHPFERWTQDEYYQLAAFFAQVDRGRGKGKDEAVIELDPEGEVEHLRTGKVMQPKLLGAAVVDLPKDQDRRVALAQWMTGKDNPFFAKAMVNRAWANIMGRGIVEPIDDFRDSNPPVNGPLLDALAKDFVASGFDFRHLVRTIMKSRSYQLTAKTVPLNKDDHTYFSHAEARLLTAEQLLDAISQVTAVPEKFEGYPAGTRAMQLAGTAARTPFLRTFGRPDRNLTCECEREKDPTLFQALALINGRGIHARLTSSDGRVAALAGSDKPTDAIVEEMYLTTLSRVPTAKEKREWASHFGRAGDRRQAVEDLTWVLINSKEFLFRY
ncbi:MAG: DUF1549 and DUF1553 domain-containing protein [Armatimonadota bacterium]